MSDAELDFMCDDDEDYDLVCMSTSMFLFLVVIYRRYIAQCRLKSIRFTTSRKINTSRVLRNLSVESQRDTTTCPAISCPSICMSTYLSIRALRRSHFVIYLELIFKMHLTLKSGNKNTEIS